MSVCWSPSSYALFKACQNKYRLLKIERWSKPRNSEHDSFLNRLAVPGLVVDKLIELFIYNGQEYSDYSWLEEHFNLVWTMFAEHKNQPQWSCEQERLDTIEETKVGLRNAFTLLSELNLSEYEIKPQPNFFEAIDSGTLITGSADLLLTSKVDGETLLLDLKNSYNRNKMTKDQLLIYQIGLQKKLGISVNSAGYLFFNHRVNDYKWFLHLNQDREAEMVEKLVEASSVVEQGTFDYKYNAYSCQRFCPARMSCDKYLSYGNR